MTEFALSLPIIVIVLFLLIFFGRGMVRVQHAQVMDRYEAWRLAGGGPGPGHDVPHGNNMLNAIFFGENAARVSYDHTNTFPQDAPNDLSQFAVTFSTAAQDLVDEVHERFERGHRVTFTTEHDNDVAVWERFVRPVRHSHTRLGDDWKHANQWRLDGDEWEYAGGGPWMLNVTRELFFSDMDQSLESIESSDNPLAGFIRTVYAARPGYRGPTVYEPSN